MSQHLKKPDSKKSLSNFGLIQMKKQDKHLNSIYTKELLALSIFEPND